MAVPVNNRTDTIYNDLQVIGTFTCSAFNCPPGAVGDAAIAAAAGVQASKLQHQYEEKYAQESATTSVTESRVLHVVRGASATLLDFKAGSVVANIGAATVVIDLLKNGVTVLTSTITLNNGVAAYALVAAVINTVACVAGDVLEAKITATAAGGTLAKGVFCQLNLREDAQ